MQTQSRTFAEVVKERRTAAGDKIGVRAFSERLGISSATLSRIENGREPDIRSFFKICKALMLSPDLFADEFTV